MTKWFFASAILLIISSFVIGYDIGYTNAKDHSPFAKIDTTRSEYGGFKRIPADSIIMGNRMPAYPDTIHISFPVPIHPYTPAKESIMIIYDRGCDTLIEFPATYEEIGGFKIFNKKKYLIKKS